MRALWARVKVTLPDKAVTYDVASSLGKELKEKGKFEELEMFYLAALKGMRRALGDEHKNTLMYLHNIGAVLNDLKDYEEALNCSQQAVSVLEDV